MRETLLIIILIAMEEVHTHTQVYTHKAEYDLMGKAWEREGCQ
jgi:hypothetical protein